MSDRLDLELHFLDASQPWTPPKAYLEHMTLAKRLKTEAQDLARPAAPQADTRIKVTGERLSRVYWKGRQWAVTSFGVECRDGTYAIKKDRLWEAEEEYGWVRHIAEKEWADLPDFAEALRIARQHHRLEEQES